MAPGSYLRLIDSCITQLKAQGPSRTCNESQEEEGSCFRVSVLGCTDTSSDRGLLDANKMIAAETRATRVCGKVALRSMTLQGRQVGTMGGVLLGWVLVSRCEWRCV